jgi:hypothetical protein
MGIDFHDIDDLAQLTPTQRWLQGRQDRVVSRAVLQDVEFSCTPYERLALANRMIFEAAKEPAIRRAGFEALRGCRNVARNGAQHLARWVRRHIDYAQEAPGVEILQGPYTTLAYRIGDCDDLAILWASLARSQGLDALMAGVAELDDPEVLLHAVAYDGDHDLHYELSQDWRYGGRAAPALRFTTPPTCYTVWWSPEAWRQGFWANDGSGYRPLEEPMLRGTMFARRMPNPTAYTSYKPLPDEGGGGGLLEDIQAGLGGIFRMGPQIVGSFLPGEEPEALEEIPEVEAPPPSRFPTGVVALLGIAGAVGLIVYLARR